MRAFNAHSLLARNRKSACWLYILILCSCFILRVSSDPRPESTQTPNHWRSLSKSLFCYTFFINITCLESQHECRLCPYWKKFIFIVPIHIFKVFDTICDICLRAKRFCCWPSGYDRMRFLWKSHKNAELDKFYHWIITDSEIQKIIMKAVSFLT